MSSHQYRTAELGEPKRVHLPQGLIEVFERGEGPAIVFSHGWLANANLWRAVVERLCGQLRCVVLDLPLGAHRVPMDPEADLSATGVGDLIAAALEALEIEQAVLVGNDSGGAYSQIAVSRHPERVASLVLTSCETPYDRFPPEAFERLPVLARNPEDLRELLSALEDPKVRKLPAAFGMLVEHPFDAEVSDSYALPCLRDEAVLRDTAKAMAGASTEAVRVAGETLIQSWERPVLLVWPREDPVFPIAHARRYAERLPNGRLIEIEGRFSFTPEDQPDALATAIREHAAAALAG